MLTNTLIQNGLTLKEAEIYLAVLEGGEVPVSRIASKTHLKRGTVYSVLEGMLQKGLISLSKRSGVQYVSALSPRNLIERFKEHSNLAVSMLPELLEMAYASPHKPRVQLFEGLEGIKEALRGFSYSKFPTVGFTDYAKMPKELYDFILKKVVNERRKNKNQAKFIVPDNPFNRKIKSEDQMRYSEHRLAKFSETASPIELLLYGESEVAFLSFAKEEMFAVLIDSKAIHQTLKNIFWLIWKFLD